MRYFETRIYLFVNAYPYLQSFCVTSQPFSKGIILLTIILMDLLAGMEFDLFSPSFPELQTHFGLTPFWVEALLSVNFLGYFLSLFFVGSLADRYGRKPIILMGLLTFILGSLLGVRGAMEQRTDLRKMSSAF